MPTIPSIMYDWAEQRPEKTITRISPSMIGRCMRTHFYAIKGVKPTTRPSPGAQLNFKLGFMWEQVMADALRAASVPFIEQLHLVDEELNMEGTADFVPFDPEKGEWEVWDSKTEGAMAAKYRAKDGHSFFRAHLEYEHQLNAYAIMLKRKGYNVTRGRFGIIVKDNGLVTEEATLFHALSLKQTMNRIEQLNKYLQDDELPPCECQGWQVGYCDFGNPHTRTKNKTGKVINSECCGTEEQLKDWRQDAN